MSPEFWGVWIPLGQVLARQQTKAHVMIQLHVRYAALPPHDFPCQVTIVYTHTCIVCS